ncbi:hypothetical protein D3C73_1265220 [compost metagenome]
MARKQFFVSPNGFRGWKVTSGGQTLKTGSTQTECAQWAAQVARNEWETRKHPTQVMIQRPDGTFRSEWTYGNDPFPPGG